MIARETDAVQGGTEGRELGKKRGRTEGKRVAPRKKAGPPRIVPSRCPATGAGLSLARFVAEFTVLARRAFIAVTDRGSLAA